MSEISVLMTAVEHKAINCEVINRSNTCLWEWGMAVCVGREALVQTPLVKHLWMELLTSASTIIQMNNGWCRTNTVRLSFCACGWVGKDCSGLDMSLRRVVLLGKQVFGTYSLAGCSESCFWVERVGRKWTAGDYTRVPMQTSLARPRPYVPISSKWPITDPTGKWGLKITVWKMDSLCVPYWTEWPSVHW